MKVKKVKVRKTKMLHYIHDNTDFAFGRVGDDLLFHFSPKDHHTWEGFVMASPEKAKKLAATLLVWADLKQKRLLRGGDDALGAKGG